MLLEVFIAHGLAGRHTHIAPRVQAPALRFDLVARGGLAQARHIAISHTRICAKHLLQPGLRFTVDQGQAVAGRYVMCLPYGCFAEAEVAGAVIATMKKGAVMSVAVRNRVAFASRSEVVPARGDQPR